jgi:iron complex outermembrane receptor protein
MSQELYDLFCEALTPFKQNRFDEVVNLRTRYLTVVLEDLYQSQNTSAILRSMESFGVQDGYLIENTNSTDLSQVINRLPGVQVADGQASIRGGVGWSYGTGNRIAVLLDDMPLLGADLGDARWKFLPIEAAEQVEVIKGASSVLYGSAALNGTINVRTGWPTMKPQTKIQSYQGVMQNYDRSIINWWEKSTQPFNNGMFFSHKQVY